MKRDMEKELTEMTGEMGTDELEALSGMELEDAISKKAKKRILKKTLSRISDGQTESARSRLLSHSKSFAVLAACLAICVIVGAVFVFPGREAGNDPETNTSISEMLGGFTLKMASDVTFEIGEDSMVKGVRFSDKNDEDYFTGSELIGKSIEQTLLTVLKHYDSAGYLEEGEALTVNFDEAPGGQNRGSAEIMTIVENYMFENGKKAVVYLGTVQEDSDDPLLEAHIGLERAKVIIAEDLATVRDLCNTYAEIVEDETGKQYYHLFIIGGGSEYEYLIDAVTGEIAEKITDGTPEAPSPQNPTIDEEAAKKLVLDFAGLPYDTECTVDCSVGIFYVAFCIDEVQRVYAVDAMTGEIAEKTLPDPLETSSPQYSKIDAETAKKIALDAAGLPYDTECKVDSSNKSVYVVTIFVDGTQLIYRVNYMDGALLREVP